MLLLAGMFGIALAATQVRTPEPITLSCSEGSRAVVHALPPSGDAVAFALGDDAPLGVWVVEHGQDVEIDAVAGERFDAQIPPRYGQTLLRLPSRATFAVRRSQPNAARGDFEVTPICDSGAVIETRLAWFIEAAPSIARARKPQSITEADRLLPTLQDLRDRAPDWATRALAMHAIAQVLWASDQSQRGAIEFEHAERAWLGLGDRERALAARVGRAEELFRAGEHAQVLAFVPSAMQPRSPSYFDVRLHNVRCLSLYTLGRHLAARTCYGTALKVLRSLDERIEVVGTVQNYAMAEQSLGHLRAAADIATSALPEAVGPSAPVMRGRLHLLLSSIAMSAGRVGEALREANAALAEFSIDGFARWKANTLIELARAYTELGTYDEAYLAIVDALGLLSVKDARGRIAAALEVLGSIDRRNHRLDEALRWTDAAQRLFDGLGQSVDHAQAHTEKLKVLLDRGELNALQQELAMPATKDTSSERVLLEIELALRRNDLHGAAVRLARLDRATLSLSQRIEAEILRARHDFASGDRAAAETVLLDARHRMEALAQTTGSITLRYLLASVGRPLQRAAVALALPTGAIRATNHDTEWLWQWSAAFASVPPRSEAHAGEELEPLSAFDRALAAELLPSMQSKSDGASRSELTRILSAQRIRGESATAPLPTLARFRSSLPADAAAVAYLDAGDRGWLLWITREEARVLPSSSPQTLRERIAQLNRRIHSADMPVAEIDAAAAQVARSLWLIAPAREPPARLRVLSGDMLASVPWPALTWPGSADALLDTTTIEQISLAPDAAVETAIARSIDLRTIIAADRNDGALPALAVASTEPALIRAAVRDRLFEIRDAGPATRATLLSALAVPDAWIHIAGHGTAQRGRLGFAGLWLDAADPSSFLSWLDVLEHGTAAGLVVLNACQLGEDSGAIANGSSSFASALVYSGSREVAAARWPVSDSASALWVPAFYAALAADPRHDAAAALRVAQRRLRDSRAFRHPWYWASLASFSRYPMAVH